MREAGDEGAAVALLEFVESTAVDNARDDFADVVRLARIGGNDAVDFLGIEERVFRSEWRGRGNGAIEVGDDAPNEGQRVRIIFRQIICDAGAARETLG